MHNEQTQSEEKNMAVVIRCVDVRYSTGSARRLLPVGFDITGAGASLRLNESDNFFQEVVDQIKLLKSVGKDIQRIIVADHFSASGNHGCAAYGNDDSRARHEKNLHRAHKALQRTFPDMSIEMLLHDIEGGTVEDIYVSE